MALIHYSDAASGGRGGITIYDQDDRVTVFVANVEETASANVPTASFEGSVVTWLRRRGWRISVPRSAARSRPAPKEVSDNA